MSGSFRFDTVSDATPRFAGRPAESLEGFLLRAKDSRVDQDSGEQ